MNQREKELLGKQLWWLSPLPRRNGGVVVLAIAAAFIAGITLGTVFAHKGDPTQTVSDEATAAISHPTH